MLRMHVSSQVRPTINMKIEPNIRRNILLILSGLVVANVRNLVQYNEFAISSIGYFFATWLAHYIAVAIVGVAAYAIYSTNRKKYIYASENSKPIEAGEFLYIISLVAIIASLAVLFFYYYVPKEIQEW